VRYRSDNSLGGGRLHFAGWRDAVTQALDEKLAVWIEHNLDDCRVFKGKAKALAEGVLEFADKAGVRLKHGEDRLLV
jgi:hypothetical protein